MPKTLVSRRQGMPIGETPSGTPDLLLRRTVDQLWAAVHALEGRIQTLTAEVSRQTARIDAIVSALGGTETED